MEDGTGRTRELCRTGKRVVHVATLIRLGRVKDLRRLRDLHRGHGRELHLSHLHAHERFATPGCQLRVKLRMK